MLLLCLLLLLLLLLPLVSPCRTMLLMGWLILTLLIPLRIQAVKSHEQLDFTQVAVEGKGPWEPCQLAVASGRPASA